MQQALSLFVKAAVTLGLLYFALRGSDFRALLQRIQSAHIGWFALAIVILLLQIAVVALRWSIIARNCGTELRLARGTHYTLIASFFNQVLPSTVGGDALRIWLFAGDGAGWSKSTYSVLLDRFFGLLTLALMVAVCLPWSLTLIKSPPGQLVLIAIGISSIAGATAFVAVGYLRWHWLMKWAPTRHLIQLSITTREIIFSIRSLAAVIALSLAGHLMSVAVTWCVAQSVDAPLQFGYALLLLPPVSLVASVPISIAGWGVRESAFVLAFVYAGLSSADGLVVSILFGAAYFIVGLAGGVAWLFSSRPTTVTSIPDHQPKI